MYSFRGLSFIILVLISGAGGVAVGLVWDMPGPPAASLPVPTPMHAEGSPLAEAATRVESGPAVLHQRLRCLEPALLQAVRKDPAAIKAAYAACGEDLGASLAPASYPDAALKAIFASLMAHALAPYGASSATALPDLLAEGELDCDNYAMLTGYFMKILGAGSVMPRFVGFDGGAVGNHAQVVAEIEGGPEFLLDPTAGIVAEIGFDALLQGRQPASRIYRFRMHDQPNIDEFAAHVMEAIRKGTYKPSDLLYFFADLEGYVTHSERVRLLWADRDADAIVGLLRTPGAPALRRNLEQIWSTAE